MPKLNYLSQSSVPRSKAQRRLHGVELGTAQESGSARERESERAVLLDGGAGPDWPDSGPEQKTLRTNSR